MAISLVLETFGTGPRRLGSLIPIKFSSLPGFVLADDRVEVEAKDRTACFETRLALTERCERTVTIGPDMVVDLWLCERRVELTVLKFRSVDVRSSLQPIGVRLCWKPCGVGKREMMQPRGKAIAC